MYKENTTFAQLMQLSNRLDFETYVISNDADKRFRDFTAKKQFAAMVFAQLTKQTGLRSLENSFAAESDLYHAGIKGKICSSTLSYANEHRSEKVFRDFYFHLVKYYENLVLPSVFKSEIKNLKLIDATVISLNKNQYSLG